MAVDPWKLLWAGGRGAIDLLEYCVASVQLEIVFTYLVADYRNRPTAERAIALYDGFCGRGAPGRIEAGGALPPRSLRLTQEIERIRQGLADVELYNASGPESPKPMAIPPRHLFDAVVAAVTAADHEGVQRIAESYDPALSPAQNLPGGRMTEGARAWVETVWRGQLRPALVRAGFARVAAVGG